MDSVPPGEVFAWHKKFGERFETPLMAAWKPHANTPDPDRPLRIGFVSGDFRRHPVGYFLEDVLASLPKTSLQLVAYANQVREDEVTDRLRPHFDFWRNIRSLNDDEAAAQIRADGIDILVDLSGHTKANRLLVFARKPAPVQVTYLGYFTSTGLKSIDYFLVDRWQAPEGEQLYYSETPFRQPGHHLCFTPPRLDIPVGPLPALRNGHVTFGNFNILAKMNDAVVASWSEILKAVPGSRLFLKSEQLDGDDVAASVHARFAAHGISADRLELEGKSPFDEYLASYQRVDIALDPFPYNGGTVTVQALWMGVPVLTLRGDCHVGRNGTSILSALDMPEWVAQDGADYIERATQLAGGLTALAALRETLRPRLLASSLCDAPRFARDLEAAFREMWRMWCSQLTKKR
jgi:predicted O-linked N-acetylglucosamine transferase (SPINDLY family)